MFRSSYFIFIETDVCLLLHDVMFAYSRIHNDNRIT